MSRSKSILAEQHLYLRFVIMIVAISGNLEATMRQIGMQIVLLLVFSLLDISAFSKLLRAVRKILPFLAAYWLFATLTGTPYPEMLLFSLKLFYFLQITVYILSHLDTAKVLADTAGIRRYHWGNSLVYYLLATMLFLKSNTGLFSRVKMRGSSNAGSMLDAIVAGAKANYARASEIDATINQEMAETRSSGFSGADVLGICLLALMVIVNAI